MDFGEGEMFAPASPIAEYFNSEVLSISVMGVVELQVPVFVDETQLINLIYELILPINPRFSSIMVKTKDGSKQWKRVEVIPENHLKVPTFPIGSNSTEFYTTCFNDYLSKISTEPLPQTQPLWEMHIIKYPTTNGAAGTVVIKIHHALGDGFSLMGALFSCLRKVDDPSIPLPLPRVRPRTYNSGSLFQKVAKLFPVAFNTVSDTCWSLSKSTFLADDESPVRSGDKGIAPRPVNIVTVAFSLHEIKRIKDKLGATINDVISGGIFYGVRLYMEEIDPKSTNSKTAALVLLNTRMLRSYHSLEEMVKTKSKSPWGNKFAFLHIAVPELTNSYSSNPLNFVWEAQQFIKRKRSSLDIHIIAKLLEFIHKIRGPNAAAKIIYDTLFNTSLAITNLVGPSEPSALANHPCKGMYFVVNNNPQSLTITVLSYVNTLRITVIAEKELIDSLKLKTCIEKAFGEIIKLASED